MKVDIKYRIPLTGEYWAGINTCPKCMHKPDLVTNELIGFANTNNGLMAIAECPKCFSKWYYHCRSGHYESFILRIQFGEQRHFKGGEGKPPQIPKIVDPRRK